MSVERFESLEDFFGEELVGAGAVSVWRVLESGLADHHAFGDSPASRQCCFEDMFGKRTTQFPLHGVTNTTAALLHRENRAEHDDFEFKIATDEIKRLL